MKNKKVLIITYYWPPSGGVGVQRWVHFAVNLKKLGFEPIVYTPQNPQFDVKDENLKALVKNIEVITSPIWEPFDLFHKLTGNKKKGEVKQGLALEGNKTTFLGNLSVWVRGNLLIPDGRKFWVKPSVKFLQPYLQEHAIELLVTTGPPHSMHLIGLALKRKLPSLKWITDFRDPWSEWDILPKLRTGKWALRLHRKLEKSVLSNADLNITVSPTLADSLASKTRKRVEVVYNGIPKQATHDVNTRSTERFIVGYFGLLNDLRNPEQLWEILEHLCQTNESFAKKLEIRLGGIIGDGILERLTNSVELKDSIHYLGYLSHEAVFEQYASSNLLLLLLNKTENAKWILPQKFFEYLSAQLPILALGPEVSDLHEIFKQHEIGYYADHQQKEKIRQFILDVASNAFSFNSNHAASLMNFYSREEQAKRFVDLMAQL